MPSARIGLDNPAFAGRLRSQSRRSDYERRAVLSYGRVMSDVRPATPKPTRQSTPRPVGRRASPNAAPARPSRSTVLMRQVVAARRQTKRRKVHFNPRAIVLSFFAGILFLFGIGVGATQLHTNKE